MFTFHNLNLNILHKYKEILVLFIIFCSKEQLKPLFYTLLGLNQIYLMLMVNANITFKMALLNAIAKFHLFLSKGSILPSLLFLWSLQYWEGKGITRFKPMSSNFILILSHPNVGGSEKKDKKACMLHDLAHYGSIVRQL